MREKVEKQKKIGNGFGFRIAQFILYLLATIGFVIGCIVWYAEFNYSKSFIGWIDDGYYGSVYVDLNGDGIFSYSECNYYDYNKEIVFYEDDKRITYKFVSEDMGAKQFKFVKEDSGEILTVKFSQFNCYNEFASGNGWQYGLEIIFYTFVGLASAMGLYAFLQALATFLGRKSIKANNLGIVINSIMVGYGVFGLVGGVKGRMYLQFTNLYGQGGAIPAAVDTASGLDEEYSADGEESATISKEEVNAENCETREVAAVAAVDEEEEVAEYIQPKMGKKGKTAIMITMIVSYSLLLLAGILLASVPSMSKIISSIGICEEIAARAYGITIGVMWIALVPSLGYYFATVSPIEPSKKVRIIISVISALLSVAMVVVFFVVINAVKIEGLIAVKEFYEGSDSWFIPVSMVFAALGFMICHALTLFRINPARIRNKKPEKCGDGLFSVIKYVFALLIYGILGLVKFILKCKEKQPDVFILVSTILLTWLVYFASFVFAIICIAVMVGVVIMYFAGFIAFAYTPSSSSGEKVFTDEYGKEIKLTEQPYVKDDRYQKVYKDEYGNEYVSDDGGRHVHRYGE